VLKVVIPGLRNIVEIPFPDRKLPVCKPCKTTFRSREQCRLQDGHTDVSWNKSYVCVILDESCITKNSLRDLCLVEEDSVRFTGRSVSEPPIPLRARNGNLGGIKAPFCTACKEKDSTRYDCREMKQHQMLPWTTVNVILSAVARGPESRSPVCNSYHSLKVGTKRTMSEISVSSSCCFGRNNVVNSMKKKKLDECGNRSNNSVTSTVVESDDIRKIESSRAFLLTIENDRSCELRWLAPCY